MKRLYITLTFIAIANAIVAQNYDFTYGDLYYKNLGDHNLMVTYPNNSYYYYGGLPKPSGDVVIPVTLKTGHSWYDEVLFSITQIGDHAFCGCSGLTSVTINDGISSIGDEAFSNCSSLSSIIIPYSVSSIGSGAFLNCSNLDSINIPNTVLSIGSGMFAGCSSLKSVTISFTTIIGTNMFKDCNSLDSITIPNSVTEIDENAFSGCTSLTEITIPDSVVRIGEGAFLNCSNLKNINIPNAVQFIGSTTFNGCDSLQYNEFDNALYLGNDENKYLWLIKAKSKAIISCEINSNCKYIADNAFDGCNKLSFVNISNSVTYIGNSAFLGCSSLSYVNIPNSVTTIKNGAFAECYNLTYINIPKSVITIEQNAFSNSNIIFYCEPSSRPKGWYYSTPYNNIYDWHNNAGTVIWDKKATITDDFVFYATDTALRKCEIYKYIGSASDLIIPSNAYFDGVEYSVTRICDDAFDGYTFHSITIESTTPPNLSNANAFQSYIPINVPCGSLANYQSANTWSELNLKTTLKYSFELSSADVEKGDVEVLREPTCEKSAIIQATAETGYAFEKWSDGSKSNPRYLTVTQDTALTAYFVVDEVEVEIASANTAQGTVSNSSGTYHYNDEIEISATANYGYHFARWSDGVTTNQRTVVLRKDTVIEAEFAVNQYTITLQTNNSELGSVTGGGTFNYLSSNEISATANTGYVFAKWEDGNTSNPRTVSLTCDTTFMAVFVPAECQLQVATSDEVKGFVSNSSGTYYYKDEVEISATANYGYHFTTWSDGVTKNPRTIQLIKDTVIEAQFAVNQYSIQLQSNDTNMGSANGAGSFDYLSTNKISATPKTGFVFHHWSDENPDNPRTITLTRDTAFTAVFVPDEVNVEVKSADTEHGTVTELSGVYHFNEKIIISAIAVPHYHFVAWSDGNRQNPRELLLRGDTVLTAAFGIDTFSVAAKCDTAMGAVSGAGLYSYGSAAKVEAKPASHHHFVQWKNGAVQTTQEFVVEHDTTFEAVFAIDRHTVALAASDSLCGAVSGAGSYDYGASVQLQATPAANCYFTGWSDGVTTNPRTLTVEGDTNIVAEFGKLQTVNIIVAANDSLRGTVAGTGSYVVGSNATLSATASAHYLFEQWSDGRTDNPRTVRAIADATYTAVFVPMQYNIILSQNNADMGMVSGSGVYSYGERVSCLAKPYPNYHFVQWSNGGTANPYEFVVEEDKMLTAYFAAGAVTAIGNESAIEPTIYAIGETIVVENATDEIRVYDAMGKLICRDVACRVRAELRVNAAGVYIVKTGNVVMRVMIND